MFENIMDKAGDLMKEEKVKEVVEKVQEFASTEKGKEVIENVIPIFCYPYKMIFDGIYCMTSFSVVCHLFHPSLILSYFSALGEF